MQDDSECSELCSCSDGGESTALSCYAICVSPAPCRTSLAYYSHASPAYQAFRGRCLCYSGKFICVRPPPGEYLLPGELWFKYRRLIAERSIKMKMGISQPGAYTDMDFVLYLLNRRSLPVGRLQLHGWVIATASHQFGRPRCRPSTAALHGAAHQQPSEYWGRPRRRRRYLQRIATVSVNKSDSRKQEEV